MKNRVKEYAWHIEWREPSELKPYEYNAKLHDDKQVKNIANSIKKFGWQQPAVVTNDDVLIIGHGRRLAALKLKCKMPVKVIEDDLTDDEIKELRLADNLTNESGWDYDLRAFDAANLEFEGFDFDLDFGESAGDAAQEVVEDEVPEPPKETISKRGDIWQLGRHRLMCGDSTSESDVAALMNGEKARMLFTSPPYSDMREYEGGKDLSVGNLCKFIAAYRPYTDYQCVNLGIQRKNNDIYEYWNEYISIARENGYKMLAWNVWDKGMTGNIGQAKAFFPLRHEWIFVFGTDFFEINLTVEKKPESIREYTAPKTKRNKDGTMEYHSTGDTSRPLKQMESVLFLHPELDNKIRTTHPATFPVGLPAEYIKAMTDKDDIVIEPFGGSGSTLIACEVLNRSCRIMELEPKYCDVIIQRFEDFTGLKAELLNG